MTDRTGDVPPGLTAALAALDPAAPAFDSATVDGAPTSPGAYALLIRMDAPETFRRRGVEHALAEGWHVYAGSARGPGGVRARLRRHLRREKTLRWHVDRLTTRAGLVRAIVFATLTECGVVAELSLSPAFAPAAPGFGSSDCRTCAAHLLRWRCP